jgi:hypothetical protein
VKHYVAKKLTYKYMGKVSQKGQQTRQIKTKKEKTEEKKHSWVTADVIIRTSGRPVDGMARFEVQVDNAQIGTYDQNNKWTPRDLEESDFPYFFSRNANGQVTHIHHDPLVYGAQSLLVKKSCVLGARDASQTMTLSQTKV